ncbi:MAG: DUF4134 family protein [Clostridiales bacterium]
MKKMLRRKKFLMSLLIVISILVIMGVNVFAVEDTDGTEGTDGTEEIEKIAGTIASVFQKIGAVAIFIGGIQIAWAMSSDNPEMKGQALKIIAAGILVVTMSTLWDTFV